MNKPAPRFINTRNRLKRVGQTTDLFFYYTTTMQIEKYTVYEFLFLPEEKKAEMSTIYNLVKFDVDCKTWTFEDVKETQYQLKKQIDYKTMIAFNRTTRN